MFVENTWTSPELREIPANSRMSKRYEEISIRVFYIISRYTAFFQFKNWMEKAEDKNNQIKQYRNLKNSRYQEEMD